MKTIDPPLRRMIIGAVEKLTGRTEKFADFYQRAVDSQQANETIWDATARVMEIKPGLRDEDLKRIPEKGPLVVVANHPIGGAEAILAAHVVGKVRKDFKFMASDVLLKIPEIAPEIIAVNVEDSGDSAIKNKVLSFNQNSLLQAMRHLKNEGVLIVFPAGEVSMAPSTMGRAVDRDWSEPIGQLILSSSSRVIPIFFDDQNGPLFQWVSRYIKTAPKASVFPAQTARRAGTKMTLQIGRPLHPVLRSKPLEGQHHYFNSSEDLTFFLQTLTYLHDKHFDDPTKKYDNVSGSLMRAILRNLRRRDKSPAKTRILEDIAQPIEKDALEAAILALRAQNPDSLLLEDREIQVYVTPRNPLVEPIIREIGREREETFRKVGEGSGKPLDLDEFDDTYLHMFIWHRVDRQIAGAYRLGMKNTLFAKSGFKGIYTHHFFDYDEKFLDRIGNAVELGRSFVSHQYQHSRTGLLIFNSLWKAIGQFLIRNPQVDSLFGPVSVSGDYSTYSKLVITTFLEKHHSGGSGFQRLIAPRAPFEHQPGTFVDDRMGRFVEILYSIFEFDAKNSENDGLTALDLVVRSIEGEKTPLPPLVKHYTKLGARYLAFSVDADFNTVDGLIVVDVDRIPEDTLNRYLGAEAATSYKKTRAR